MKVGLRLTVEKRGDFEAELAAGGRRAATALRSAVFAYGEEVQAQWRQDVANGFRRGRDLTRTIRLNKYPNRGYDAAVLVYSNFPLLQRAFEEAKTLKAHNGKYLLVPNPDVWPTGRATRAQGGSGIGGNYSPTWYTAMRRFGELKIVPPRNGKAGMVVADVALTPAGAAIRKLSHGQRRAGTPRQQIVVFFLARQTRQPRLLRGQEIRRRAGANAATRVQQLFVRFLDQGAEVRALPSA